MHTIGIALGDLQIARSQERGRKKQRGKYRRQNQPPRGRRHLKFFAILIIALALPLRQVIAKYLLRLNFFRRRKRYFSFFTKGKESEHIF